VSNPINDGGPAFPEPFEHRPEQGLYGQDVSSSDIGRGGIPVRGRDAESEGTMNLENLFIEQFRAQKRAYRRLRLGWIGHGLILGFAAGVVVGIIVMVFAVHFFYAN
jgi:hypothetical protein